MSATVTVRGEGSAPARPDEAVLVLETTALEQAPDVALDTVAARSAQIAELLDEIGLPQDARTTTGVSVHEEREYEHNRVVFRGYRATGRLSVRIADTALIGRVMSEATRRTGARIGGPAWRIAPDNPAWTEARTAAARDARGRAEAYASALDLRLGAVQSISEPGGHAIPQRDVMMARAAMAPMEAAPDMPVESAGIEVSASVEVTFALEPGSPPATT